MAMWLRQSTASQEIQLGMFVDDTDFKTAETGLTIANTDIKLFKHGATSQASKNSGGATHIANGWYYAVLDATDTNTLGLLEVTVNVSGALSVRREFMILPAMIYDSLVLGTDRLDTNTTHINDVATSSVTTIAAVLGTTSAPTITSGRINADITHIATAAVSTSTAQLGVNVVNFGGSAGTFASGRPAVNASYIGGVPVTATTSITFPSTCTVATTTGAVGSVTGNVGGNVTGSVGSIATNGIAATSIATGAITAAKFAAGAIDAAAIANGAIDAATFAADVDAEILSYIVDDATRIDASALNTAMGTTIPTNLDAAVSTRATPAQVNTEVDTALADIHLDHLLATTYDPANKPGAADALLNELVESDGGVARFTANALEQAPTGGSAPTVEQIADEVQTRTIAAVTTVGSVSGAVGSVVGAVGSVTGDVGGKVLGGGGSTITGTGARADLRAWNGTAPGNLDSNGYVPGNIAAINGNLTRAANLSSACDNYSATRGLTGTAVPAVAAGGAGGLPTDSTGKTAFNDITAASVWSVGTRTLTSLSGLTVDSVAGTVGGIAGTITTLDALDTAQDSQHATTQGLVTTADTVVDAIKAKTDSLTFTVAGQVDANIQYVNDTQVNGTGATGDEWGPV